MFVTRLFIGATTVDQITHDYCVNSDTFSCNGSNGNNTGGNNTGGNNNTTNNNTTNNSTGLIYIESIWRGAEGGITPSEFEYTATVGVQDMGMGTNWTVYYAVYSAICSDSELFGTTNAWDYASGWWTEGYCPITGDVGTKTPGDGFTYPSSGETVFDIITLNSWAALPGDNCGTLVVTLFGGDLGNASGQTTPATTYPISYDSMVFGPEGCAYNDTIDQSIEMFEVPEPFDCVLDSFTLNATLYDPYNLSGGDTDLTIVITQDIYDSNGNLDDDLFSSSFGSFHKYFV